MYPILILLEGAETSVGASGGWVMVRQLLALAD
jgi:hypothetical protein